MLERIAEGRTDLVAEYLTAGNSAFAKSKDGSSLLQWCAYYGDVSALKLLLAKGEDLHSLGQDLGLNGAAFHGHWRLCEFLLENGADANYTDPETGETPLHSALSSHRRSQHQVVQVLLAKAADPNRQTRAGKETGAFMRDVRTRGETPLHRAAAFASAETIQLLLNADAKLDTKDANGDSPLSWGSWYLRADSILRMLCYGAFKIRPDRKTMEENLIGRPTSEG